MTKEFILETLLPYKEDVSLCSTESGICVYLTTDGRKCAVGKHLIDGPAQSYSGNVYSLDGRYCLNDILTEEAKEQNIPLLVWNSIQCYHDKLSYLYKCKSDYLQYRINGVNEALDNLEESTNFKFPELRFVEQ